MKTRLDFREGSYKYSFPRVADEVASLYYSTLNGYEEIGSNYYLERKDVPNVLLTMTMRGEAVMRYGGEMHALKKGALVFIDCREPHIFYPTSEDWSILYLHVSGGDSFAIRREFYDVFGPVCYDFSIDLYAGEIKKIFTLQKASGNRLCEISACIYNLLMRILAHCREKKAPLVSKSVYAAQIFIRENYRKDIGVAEVAGAVNLSKYHLEREFRKHTGASIAETIADLRFAYSKTLLANKSCTVSFAAEEAGFHSTQPLIKMYKERLGIVPSKYYAYVDEVLMEP